MILPNTSNGALVLIVISLLCLGSWANFYKLAGKWRFELFYFDFAIGLTLAAVIAAFTLGNMGFDGFSLSDDLIHAGRRQWLFAFVAGVVFNLGNMLMAAAMSVGGMAVAFPVAMGLTLCVAMLMGDLSGAKVNTTYVMLGWLVLLAAIAADGLAYRSVTRARRAAVTPDPKTGRKPRVAGPAKAMILAVAGGLAMAGSYLPLAIATPPEVGLGPYSLALLFSCGMLFSTFVYNIFFMNLPVEGEPLEIFDYLKAKPSLHLYGLVGGMVWCAGNLSHWVAAMAAAPSAQLSPQLALGLPQASMLVAALWGVAVWRDFREASFGGKLMAVLMLLLVAGGIVLMSLAVAPQR
ncbi:MAG TPA: hypothetical protein VE959_08085 [Bryobacteraceae bacterium]|nr:hypothetical protein [Bryobacteraceae bacterium]